MSSAMKMRMFGRSGSAAASSTWRRSKGQAMAIAKKSTGRLRLVSGIGVA
jgi:hypothetical protein